MLRNGNHWDDALVLDLTLATDLTDCERLVQQASREDLECIDLRTGGTLFTMLSTCAKPEILDWAFKKFTFNPLHADHDGNTALHLAIAHDNFSCVKTLIELGCSVNYRNHYGDTPLHICMRSKNLAAAGARDTFKIFIDNGADFKLRNNSGCSVIGCALRRLDFLRELSILMREKQMNVITDRFVLLTDLSLGLENFCVPLLNLTLEHCNIPDFFYTSTVLARSDIGIELDEDDGCACTNGCLDNCPCSTRGCLSYSSFNRLRCFPDINEAKLQVLCECVDTCRCQNCLNSAVKKGSQFPVEVHFVSQQLGYGLRAASEIPAGAYVGHYSGELITEAQGRTVLDDNYLFDVPSAGQVKYHIDAKRYGNFTRFLNHSCDPNLVVIPVQCSRSSVFFKLCFFTLREVLPGNELNFDYGCEFWHIKEKVFRCLCCSTACQYPDMDLLKQLLPPENNPILCTEDKH